MNSLGVVQPGSYRKMSANIAHTLSSPPSSFSLHALTTTVGSSTPAYVTFSIRRSPFPPLRSSSSSSSHLHSSLRTELDAISSFSEIVPDTVIFDDFQKFPPTAATVTSSLLLGILSLPDTIFKNAVDNALADSNFVRIDDADVRLSCFFNKALVNVGADLVKLVPGRVSTEVDSRQAYDTHGIVRKVLDLLKLYDDIEIPPERLLFKIPSTWQGIEAARILESEGIQTHLTFVYSFAQAAAAAQAGASVIQIFAGRVRDWAHSNSGDPEVEAAIRRGEDPGLALVAKTYNYIHKYGYKTKLMAAAVRNKQDLFSLLGVDYIIAPVKVLQSLKESVTSADEKYAFVRRLSPQSASTYEFTQQELVKWDEKRLESAMGPAAVELLRAGVDGCSDQARRVEELFRKIWPPPNV